MDTQLLIADGVYELFFFYIYIMAYRKIPFFLWHIDVGLHTFIFLFMTSYKGPLFITETSLC